MRPFLHLAVAFFLTATAMLTHAQVQNEAPTQVHTPTLNPHHRSRPEDLSWLWPYTRPDGGANALVNDPRFTPFLKSYLRAPQSFWTRGQPLPAVVRDFLGVPGDVLAEGNRYLTITGCVPHFCPSRGLLWIDTGLPEPLVAFAAIDWISDNRTSADKDSAYTLWLFPSRPLIRTHLPPALVQSLTRWTAQPSSGSTDLQNITRVYLVDPDGTPHTLSPATIGAHNTLPAETTDEQKAQP